MPDHYHKKQQNSFWKLSYTPKRITTYNTEIGNIGASMELNKEQMEKLKEYIDTKLQETTCPICQGKNWKATTRIYKLPEYKGNEAVFPVIPIFCTGCGNVLLISPKRAGILEKRDK